MGTKGSTKSSARGGTNWTPINIALIIAILVIMVVSPPWETSGVTTLTGKTPAGVAPAAAAAPAAPAVADPLGPSMCELAGKRYECGSSVFDWRFYSTSHGDLASMSAVPAMEHWIDHGIKEGRRGHSGQRVVKLVLMTKDEWPLVRSWVLYHAHVFGGNNIYVLDGSSDKTVTSFLTQAECQLGVHVFRFAAGFGNLAEMMSQLMRTLALSADLLVKMDTDEFLAVSRADASGVRSFIVGPAVRDYLDSLPFKGGNPLVANQFVNTVPSQTCSDDPAAAAAYLPAAPRDKMFVQGPAFVSIDLGGTGQGLTQSAGFDVTPQPASDLQILHITAACYENWVANNRRACVSYGYIAETDSDADARPKLEAKETAPEGYPGKEKVAGYLAHLMDPAAAKQAYYGRFAGAPTTFTGLRNLLAILQKDYEKALRERGNKCR